MIYLSNMVIFHSYVFPIHLPIENDGFSMATLSNQRVYIYILVGGWPTPLKNMSSSVGMMKFPIYGKIKFMFQATNQIFIYKLLVNYGF